MLPDPRDLELVEWTDYVNLDVGSYGIAPILRDESEWREWAATVCSFQEIAARSPPSPYAFDDWKDWATRFIQSTSTLP